MEDGHETTDYHLLDGALGESSIYTQDPMVSSVWSLLNAKVAQRHEPFNVYVYFRLINY